MITHASIILRPIIDYVLLATQGDCKISICDVPLQSADWNELIILSGLKDLIGFYRENGAKIDLLDLRYEISKQNKWEVLVEREKNTGSIRIPDS